MAGAFRYTLWKRSEVLYSLNFVSTSGFSSNFFWSSYSALTEKSMLPQGPGPHWKEMPFHGRSGAGNRPWGKAFPGDRRLVFAVLPAPYSERNSPANQNNNADNRQNSRRLHPRKEIQSHSREPLRFREVVLRIERKVPVRSNLKRGSRYNKKIAIWS